jgi:iron(III) transport system ATP-binding protein
MNPKPQEPIRAIGLSVSYGQDEVIRDLDLTLTQGSLHALLGESGSGKTTLLRAIMGFEPLSGGKMEIDGRVVDDPTEGIQMAPETRQVGMVFQDYALFPHLTVGENIGFGMEHQDGKQIASMLETVSLSGYGNRSIGELSGGEQQRVALARAIAQNPKIILLDEPFSNLNRELRSRLRTNTRQILKDRGITALFVTHDAEEAFAIADHISVMQEGRILQTGTPEELYDRPVDMNVARSLGDAHFFAAEVSADGTTVDTVLGQIPLRRNHSHRGNRVMVRPEQIILHETSSVSKGVAGQVKNCIFQGPICVAYIELPDGTQLAAQVPRQQMPTASSVDVQVTGEGILLEGI